jgi:CheY-like chemotaxis protein
MPEMSGVEVTRAVRRTGNPVYIVGCTGNALKEDQEEYVGAGADQVLTKPVKQAALVEAIEMARRRVAGETVPRGFAKSQHAPLKSITV